MQKVKITLRLGKQDNDLDRLTSHYQTKAVIVFAVRKHLAKSAESLSLPPEENGMHMYQWRTATISESDAPDVYAFLAAIPEQNRAEVVRRLLRRATDECDLRDFMESPPLKAQTRPRKAKVTKQMPKPEPALSCQPAEVLPQPPTQQKQEHKRTYPQAEVNLDVRAPSQKQPSPKQVEAASISEATNKQASPTQQRPQPATQPKPQDDIWSLL